VPQASAVIPGATDAEPVVMHSDHVNMVKFKSRLDEGYKKILDYIQIMTQAAPNEVACKWERESKVKAGRRCLMYSCHSMHAEELTSSSSDR
jgi:hypothetical protein